MKKSGSGVPRINLRFFGRTYPVRFCALSNDEDNAQGVYTRQHGIEVEESLKPPLRAEIVCHEAIHALFDTLGMDEIPMFKEFEEFLAVVIGQRFIPELIRLNPELVRELRKGMEDDET